MGSFTKEHSIGKTIATLRKEKGWTQVEFAEKLQVSDKAISKWEKDDSYPSVEFFPVLSKLFGVSIDYLMTGKAPEKEIVIMSKAEFCAKNDDVSMLEIIRIDTKDENGKTVVDYAKTYHSKNVITTIINKYGFKGLINFDLSNNFNPTRFTEALYYSIWTNTLDLLENTVSHSQYNTKDDRFWLALTSLEEKDLNSSHLKNMFELLTTDKTIAAPVFDTLFSKRDIGNTSCKAIWDIGLSYLLELALINGNQPLFEKYYTFLQEMNQASFALINEVKKDSNCKNSSDWYSYETPLNTATRKNPIVAIRISTIEWLIENEKVDLAEELHLFNVKFGLASIDDDIIRIAKLKASKNVSADELTIQSAIHKGILSIDEILATKNYTLASSAIQKYPIHFVETLIAWFNEEKWRELFEFAVDNSTNRQQHDYDYSSLARHITKFDKAAIEKDILDYWNGSASSKNINVNHLYFFERDKKIELLAWYYGRRLFEAKTLEEIIYKISACKKRILDDFALNLGKDSAIRELTKEFFYEALDKGDTDIVIINLCIRLEAILKYDYRYEGNFSEMLKQYCDQKLHWYEEDEDIIEKSDSKTIKLLNNLRMKRNSILHSDNVEVNLTIEDIRYCIEYLCKMG